MRVNIYLYALLMPREVQEKPHLREMKKKYQGHCCVQISQALISNEPAAKETIVQENGKVLADIDDGNQRAYSILSEYYDNKTNRQLRLKKKLSEFYTAPITKFWANAIAYMVFLFIFSYSILVKMDANPSYAEIYAISYIITLGCEKVREIISSEPVVFSHKFSVWAWNMWNPFDAGAIIFFTVGLVLRLRRSTFEIGRVIYCVDCMYWYLRMLNILGVNKYLGPLVTMMGKMVKNMIYFVVLLLVVLMSFGVARQAILNPNAEPKWRIIRDVLMEPYFMLYGEVYADNIYPECGDEPGMMACLPGRWITPIAMSIYLLVANILLINLLIAVFNNIFIEVNAVAHQVWMFQRFTVVMEYEQKPVLPPPLIAVSHIYMFIRFLFRYLRQGEISTGETCDNGLKLFLEADDKERLYDFEEDCVDGYFREKEQKLQMSTDERIKITTERVENMNQKIEDINKKEHTQNASLQAVEFRIRQLEELNEQTLAHLGVIHRFMATHVPDKQGLPSIDAEIRRSRGVSERSEAAFSETGSHTYLPTFGLRRRKLLKSMTDAPFLNVGHSTDEEMAKPIDVVASQDNLSQNESSISIDQPGNGVQEDFKVLTTTTTMTMTTTTTTTTSQDESEGSKVVASDAARKEEKERRSTTVSAPESRQNSGEKTSWQNSRTRSESEHAPQIPPVQSQPKGVTWAESRVGAKQAVNPRCSLLLAMRADYTSITDELESLLSPPRSPPLSPPPSRDKHSTSGDISDPEIAWQIENEHLRDAEECDYQQMEDLIQRRYMDDNQEETRSFENGVRPFNIISEQQRLLKRAAAIDEDTRRPPPTISVTKELEQTLSRPLVMRDSETSNSTDKEMSTVPAPASETMC